MSFSGREARAFFNPLTGRTTTFILDGRQSNLDFARTIAGLLAQAMDSCTVLDLDGLYSSNSEQIFALLTPPQSRESTLRIPEPGSDIEGELSKLFEAPQRVVIIDSLNSLHHLISLEDGAARSRKLTFTIASLSYLARANGKAIILTMYRREGFYHSGKGRTISNLSDITASVGISGRELNIRNERGLAWPGGEFSTRIP